MEKALAACRETGGHVKRHGHRDTVTDRQTDGQTGKDETQRLRAMGTISGERPQAKVESDSELLQGCGAHVRVRCWDVMIASLYCRIPAVTVYPSEGEFQKAFFNKNRTAVSGASKPNCSGNEGRGLHTAKVEMASTHSPLPSLRKTGDDVVVRRRLPGSQSSGDDARKRKMRKRGEDDVVEVVEPWKGAGGRSW